MRDALARAGHRRGAEGPRELRLPSSPRARRARGPAAVARRRAPPAARSSRSRARRERGDRASSPTSPRTRRSGRSSRRRATTASARTARSTRDCFVMKARKDALDADVVVVNHHLFFADVMLRDEGLAELLPDCNTVILDEAHQLPDTATLFFGEQVTAGQLAELARDAEVAARTAARDVPEPAGRRGASSCPRVRKLRLAAGEARRQVRAATSSLAREGFAEALDELAAALDRLAAEMGHFAERSEDLAHDRAARRGRRGATGALARGPCRRERRRRRRRMDPLDRRHAARLAAAGVAAVDAPTSFAARSKATARAWIFTSATLAVGRDFSHYTAQLGLDDAATGAWDSPFDYAPQALLYVPRDLPAPNSREHTDAVVDAALPVLKASGGRAFLLFTTLRALAAARERLADALRARGPRLSAARAGRRLEDRAARCAFARSATPCCSAARASGKASTCRATRCRWSSSTSCRSRRRTIRCSRRGSTQLSADGGNPFMRLAAAAGGDQPEAGRGPPDPHRDRPRRADDLRPAPHRQALRPAHLAERCRRCAARATSATRSRSTAPRNRPPSR